MEPLLLYSDFKIPVDIQDNPNAESFVDLMGSVGLAQDVLFATHI